MFPLSVSNVLFPLGGVILKAMPERRIYLDIILSIQEVVWVFSYARVSFLKGNYYNYSKILSPPKMWVGSSPLIWRILHVSV